MKKYSTPLVTASDVARETMVGTRVKTTTEIPPLTSKTGLGFGL